MAIVSPELVKSLFVNFNKSFQDGLQMAPSEYKTIASVIPSTSAQNIYAWLGQFPHLREWVGARVINSMQSDGYTLINKLYEATVGVPQTAIEDDTVGVYSPLFQEAGRAAGVYPDEHIFRLLKLGDQTTCYDGQNFFDTDHPVFENVDGTGAVKLVSNLLTPASGGEVSPEPWYLMDTTRVIKPLIFQERIKANVKAKTTDDNHHVFMNDEYLYGIRARSAVGFGFWQLAVMSTKPLNAESFEEARQVLRTLKADGGRPLNITPNLLVVPPALSGAAFKVVGQENISGSTNPNYKKAETFESAWLNF